MDLGKGLERFHGENTRMWRSRGGQKPGLCKWPRITHVAGP